MNRSTVWDTLADENIRLLYLALFLCLVIFIVGCSSGQIKNKRTIASWHQTKWENVERQKFDYSCGAAALATIGRYYFNDPINEQLTIAILVNQLSPVGLKDRIAKGFSLLDLKKAAGHLGYMAEGVRLKAEDIEKLQGPIIVIINDGTLDHFVVLKGKYKDRIYLADSVRGNVRIPFFRFLTQWNGTALILGKDGFGLPHDHGLSVDSWDDYRPEVNSVRQMSPSYHQ